jgi:hypothetical protein
MSRWRGPSRVPGTVAAALAALVLSSCAGNAQAPPDSSGVPLAPYSPAAATWWPPVPPPDRWYPVAAIVLPGGGVVVAESGQNRIFLLEADGRVERLPAPGRTVVEWTALAVGPGLFFYALDGPGLAVHQYDYEGNYVGLAVDLARTADQQGLGHVEPAGLAVDRSGQAVVTDRAGDRLLVFGPGWTYTGVWGQSGTEPGSWRGPERIAVGGRPPYLVADAGNRRLVLIDRFGDVLAWRALGDPPRGVAVPGADRYAVTLRDRVEILGRDLQLIRTYVLPRDEGCEGTPYATPALAGEGPALFVGEGCSGRVVELRPLRE